MSLKVTVITGDHFCPDPEKRTGKFAEEDFVTHKAMVEAVKSIPFIDEVSVLNDHKDLLSRLSAIRPDLVVNFCDTGLFNNIKMELHLPALLEFLNISYTGATPASIVTCYDKAIVRNLAEDLHIPVPKEELAAWREGLPSAIDFPAILKPNKADGSFGILKESVVTNFADAETYWRWLQVNVPGRDILIQEYLPGPEYGVGVIGNGSDLYFLSPLEVDFSDLPNELPPILSYESKAIPGSPYWDKIKFKQADLNGRELAELHQSCRRLFNRLGMQDYARFDFRRGEDGTIKLMEVNPNPAWANDGKLAFMASFDGITYPEMLELIIRTALRRTGHFD